MESISLHALEGYEPFQTEYFSLNEACKDFIAKGMAEPFYAVEHAEAVGAWIGDGFSLPSAALGDIPRVEERIKSYVAKHWNEARCSFRGVARFNPRRATIGETGSLFEPASLFELDCCSGITEWGGTLC